MTCRSYRALAFALSLFALYFSVHLCLLYVEFPSPFFYVGSAERWEFRQSWLAIYAAHTDILYVYNMQREKWRPFFWFISQLVLPPYVYNKRSYNTWEIYNPLSVPVTLSCSSHSLAHSSRWQVRRGRKSETFVVDVPSHLTNAD
jgi:hypothetical protein